MYCDLTLKAYILFEYINMLIHSKNPNGTKSTWNFSESLSQDRNFKAQLSFFEFQ